MTEYSMGYYLGAGAGVIVGLILIAVVFKFVRKDGSYRCKYDERQELVRGRGFKYGFLTMLIYQAGVTFFGNILEGFIELNILSIIGICLGMVVYATYSIWNDGYVAVNENPQRLIIVFGGVSILNLIIGIRNGIEGKICINGIVSYGAINVVCGILLLIIFVEMIMKYVCIKNKDER